MLSSLGAASVPVVQAHPGHRIGEPRLIAALRHEVQMMIGPVQHVEHARIARKV
jgi:hypothetical protein